jgi:murein DD-endopeptidase MepM/ murein hydrolase activator NlpD
MAKHRVATTVLAISVAFGAGLAGASTQLSPAAARAPLASSSWSWPIAAPHPILRPYLAPATPYGPGHRGIDIGAPDGSALGVGVPVPVPVLAPTDGVVSFAGVVVDRPVLSIRHAGGLVPSYEPVVTTLAAGDSVARGAVIGELQAGHCVQPCLHFGVRLDGGYVSPLNYLGGIPWSVLLPTR